MNNKEPYLCWIFSIGPDYYLLKNANLARSGFKLTSQSRIMKNYMKNFLLFSVTWRATMVQGAEYFEILHAVEIFEKWNIQR